MLLIYLNQLLYGVFMDNHNQYKVRREHIVKNLWKEFYFRIT